jgi:hypothetical protein
MTAIAVLPKLLMVLLWILNLWILIIVISTGTFIYKKRYWIPFYYCLAIFIIGTAAISVLEWVLIFKIVTIIGLLGMPTIYSIYFRQKEGKTTVDYLKHCWLILFIVSKIYGTISIIPDSGKIPMNITYFSNVMGVISAIVLLVIYLLLMINKREKKKLTESSDKKALR